MYCTCKNPSGFVFVEVKGGMQIWRHIICGKNVTRAYSTGDKK